MSLCIFRQIWDYLSGNKTCLLQAIFSSNHQFYLLSISKNITFSSGKTGNPKNSHLCNNPEIKDDEDGDLFGSTPAEVREAESTRRTSLIVINVLIHIRINVPHWIITVMRIWSLLMMRSLKKSRAQQQQQQKRLQRNQKTVMHIPSISETFCLSTNSPAIFGRPRYRST